MNLHQECKAFIRSKNLQTTKEHVIHNRKDPDSNKFSSGECCTEEKFYNSTKEENTRQIKPCHYPFLSLNHKLVPGRALMTSGVKIAGEMKTGLAINIVKIRQNSKGLNKHLSAGRYISYTCCTKNLIPKG
uniref:Uncharacterized protein n=1 Tax=Arundo donax TaxID=35708 RepID=A0A0A9DL95_ARUDO